MTAIQGHTFTSAAWRGASRFYVLFSIEIVFSSFVIHHKFSACPKKDNVSIVRRKKREALSQRASFISQAGKGKREESLSKIKTYFCRFNSKYCQVMSAMKNYCIN